MNCPSALERNVSRRTGDLDRAPQPSKADVLALVQKYGWNATSFQTLGLDLEYWFTRDACVAYLDTGKAWVVAGAPIAAENRLQEVTLAFGREAAAHGRRTAFFATEYRFIEAVGFPWIAIGEQPIWRPSDWAGTLAGSRSIREQLRRAQNKGVVVEQINAHHLENPKAVLRKEIQHLIDSWVALKPLPSMGFLVRVHPFLFAQERRMFVARVRGELVGFAGVVPVYARNGWFVEDLVRASDAPNGTVELLVDAAMRDAAALGSEYVTLGLAPLSGVVEKRLRAIRKYSSPLYDFDGLRAFKAKFRPHSWVPIYLAFPPERTASGAVYDSLAAFSSGGLTGFGIEAFLRGPDIVVRGLAGLLVPWTIALMFLDAKRWFLAPEIKWFWLAFDAALCGCLVAIGRYRRRWLVDLTIGMAIFDAGSTMVLSSLIDLPRISNPLEAALFAIAITAPLLACAVLLNMRRRLRRLWSK